MEQPISFRLSDSAVKYAEHMMEAPDLSDDISLILKAASTSKTMDLPEMIKVFEWRCEKYKTNGQQMDVFSAYPLLENASMMLPELPKREPNPELQERLKRLAAQQEHREYNKMVENVSRKEPIRPKRKNRSSVISGLNFALTLFASCGASMFLLQNIFPDIALRAGIGMVVGTIILMIEIYLAVREVERETKKKK